MPTLSRTIRERRRARELSLVEAAERANVAKSYLSMIENDRLENPPSPAVLGRLERVLETAPGELVRMAAWERAPAWVRAEAAELSERAERARALGRWLTEAATSRGGGSLDALYASGDLQKRIEQAVGRFPEGGNATPPPDSAADGAASMSGFPFPGAGAGTGVVGGLRSVPLINKVAAGYPADFTDLGYPARVADDYVPAPPGLDDPDVFAAYVDGESMQPAYRAGDVVVFSPGADVTDGCDCFVRLEESHETTFKRVYLEDEGRMIRLQPLNPKFPPRTLPREEVAGLYRAVWRMSRL